MASIGDTDKLKKFRAELSAAQVAGRIIRLREAMANEVLTQVQLGFKTSTDPYGKPWAPLKYRVGMPLRDSGRLANSFTARPKPDGYAVGTNVEYAIYQQWGTKGRKVDTTRLQAVSKKGRFISKAKAAKIKKGSVAFRRLHFKSGGGGIPARHMFPIDATTPPRWKPAIEAAVNVAFNNWSRAFPT